MSVVFPTEKDELIDELEETYELGLTEQESKELRRLTNSQLLFVTLLFARAARRAKLNSQL